jgi:hypothetical protein
MGYFKVRIPRFDWASSLGIEGKSLAYVKEEYRIPDVRVLLAHTNHYTLVTGTTNNRAANEPLERSMRRLPLTTYGNTARGASSPANESVDATSDGR